MGKLDNPLGNVEDGQDVVVTPDGKQGKIDPKKVDDMLKGMPKIELPE